MRKLLFLAVLTAFLISFVGCGGKELNDDTLPEAWVKAYDADSEEEADDILAGWGTDTEAFSTYAEELAEDADRYEKVLSAIAELDNIAAMVFAEEFGPGDFFEDLLIDEEFEMVEGGNEMTDELLAQLFVSIYPEQPNSPAAQPILEGYGVTLEQVEEYFDDMMQDPDHCAAVSALVHGLDPEKGAGFDEITAGEPVSAEEAPE